MIGYGISEEVGLHLQGTCVDAATCQARDRSGSCLPLILLYVL